MSDSRYHIAVCDDDPQLLLKLEHLTETILSEENILFQITCFQDSIRLLEEIIAHPKEYQLILLDILMETLDGMVLAERLRQSKVDIPIVFISSTSDFALRGYEVQAHRYLLKPVEKDKLKDAVKAILEGDN